MGQQTSTHSQGDRPLRKSGLRVAAFVRGDGTIQAVVIESLKALGRFPGQVFHWWKTSFPNLLLVIPVFVAGLVYAMSSMDLLGWSDEVWAKGQLEITHPAVLSAALVLALVGLIIFRDVALRLMLVLCGALLAREILGQGNSWIVYAAAVILIIWAHHRRSALAPVMAHAPASCALFLAFVSYAASQFLDRGLVEKLGRLLSRNPDWELLYSSNMEESLETLGGCFVLVAVISVIRFLKGQTPEAD